MPDLKGILSLASLDDDAGNCERLDQFLSRAVRRVRTLTRAREGFILVVTGAGDRFHNVVTDSDLESVLRAPLASLPLASAAPSETGPFELATILEEARQHLIAQAASRRLGTLRLWLLELEREPAGLLGLLEPDLGALEGVLPAILSIAIANFRLFSEARRNLARQSFLREVGRIFAAEGTLVEKTRSFLVRLGLLRGVDGCSVTLGDPATGHYAPLASSHLDSATDDVAQRLAERVAWQGDLLHVEDLAGVSAGPVGSYLGIPLVRREIVIGVLSIYGRQPRAYSRKDLEFFASVSEQIALNIDHARLLEQTRQQLQELSSVFRFSAILRRAHTLPEMMASILEQCVRSIQGDQGHLLVFEEGFLEPAASWGAGDLGMVRVPLSCERSEMMLGQRYWAQPAREFSDIFPGLPLGTHNWLLIPLRTEQGLLGVLLVGHRSGEELGADRRRLLLTLTNVAENAIGRARGFEEARARAREEAASRAKSEFLAIMSHELRTPMTAILGFTELLLGKHCGPLQEKQEDYLQDIQHNGNHLLSLINDVLDLAKVEGGKVELAYEALDLEQVLQEVEASFWALAERRGVQLSFTPPASYPCLQADRRRLKQVLYNLVSNAVKFTRSGGRVAVVVRQTNGSVTLQVEDTGIGIPRDCLETIFQPFSQVRQPVDAGYEGTGLGLSLTRKLVELHGGRIWAESELGHGSTFFVELPSGVRG